MAVPVEMSHAKTLAQGTMISEIRGASWTAVGEGPGAHTAFGTRGNLQHSTFIFQLSTFNRTRQLQLKAVSAPFPFSHRSPRHAGAQCDDF